MKAVIAKELNQYPIVDEFELPQKLENESVVSVEYAAIKQLDKAIVKGTHYSSPKQLPIVPGTDGVGLLENGERVYFTSFRQPYGAMAEQSVGSLTVAVPEQLESAFVAALINPALAAYLPLVWRAKMQKDETVLIIGATGASGKLAVTMARKLGAKRVVVAGRNQEILNELDADARVDLTLDTEQLIQAFSCAAGVDGYDVILDYVWGGATEALLLALNNQDLENHSVIKPEGVRLVNVGTMAAPNIRLSGAVLRSVDLKILGSGTGNFPPHDLLKRMIEDILNIAKEGDFDLPYRVFDMEQVQEAWDSLNTKDPRPVLKIQKF